MQLITYLSFDGRCEKAFKFYEKCLGGKIEMMMPYTGTPAEAHVPADWAGKIMHAHLQIDGASLMGSDAAPQHYSPMKGSSLSIQVDGAANAERIFKAMSENGNVTMPLEKTFWAARFGMFHDQYGISWMVNCEKE